MSDLALVAVAALAGALVGAAWRPLVPLLGARSADAASQPAWTLRLTATPALAGAGALSFAATALALGPRAALLPGLCLCALLVGVTAIDLRFRIVPNRLVALGTPLGLALQLALEPGRWLELLVAMAVAFLFLFAAAVVAPGGLGMGDVKLAAMLGAFLGRAVSVALMAGLVAASLPSILVLAHAGLHNGRKATLPLGPFLALGGLVALLFGQRLLHWYWGAGR